MSNQTSRKKNNRTNKKRPVNPLAGGQLASIPSLRGPSYQGQYQQIFNIPGNLFKASSIITGTMSFVYGVGNFNAGNVASWTTKWENLYDEYRILGADFKVYPISINAGGLAHFYWDEFNAGAASLIDTRTRVVNRVQVAQSGQKFFKFTWRARDLGDLVYIDTSVDVISAYFKGYGDALNYALPIAINDLFIIVPNFWVQFRGLKT
jgi:hypothetical protein